MRPMSSRIIIRLALLSVLMQAASVAAPPTSAPAAEPFERVVKLLADEARQSKERGELIRGRANIADTFRLDLPLEKLGGRILRRQHDDAFIDAYIRWQLTSFKPSLSRLSDREAHRAIENLPTLLENPRADEVLIASLQKAAQAGPLSSSDQTMLNQRLNDLATRASRIDAMNQPALSFRKWSADQLPSRGLQPCLAGLEQISASIRAGWPPNEPKAELELVLIRSATDRRFTSDQRREFVMAAEKIVGNARVLVVSARIQENVLSVELATIAVDEFEVKRWVQLLDPRSTIDSPNQ